MKNAIILHGRPSRSEYFESDKPSPSNYHWLPWLQRELLRKGYLAQAPEVLNPFEPRYENWQRAIEYFEPDEGTLLVGHSCGAGMIVQWLSKNPDIKVGKVILVAPWIDVEKEGRPAFDFELDKDIASRTAGLTIFHSLNDSDEIQSSVIILRKKLQNAKYREFPEMGHFNIGTMRTQEFPELLDECLKGNT